VGRCVVQTALGRFAGCVLALSLIAGLVSCSEPDPQPSTSPIPAASSPSPSRTASPTPSADEQNLREAERAVFRFWRVIDRLSADPNSDLTQLTTVSRGAVAAQWARNINQYRFDRVKAEGRVDVRDVAAKQSKKDDVYKVTACIDASNVNLVDKNKRSVVPPEGPRRVSYDYTVEQDQKKWYVVKEKVTETC
jgi:ribosomal protein L24